MSKALLINPSYFGTYGSNEGGIAAPVYPVLSLAMLAGAARERGHDAEILDLSYRPYDPDLIRATIQDRRPDIVAVTATTPLTNQLRDISHVVKNVSEDILVVGGGAHPTALPSETMGQSRLDLLAQGEADFVIADLLDGKDPTSIQGLWSRDGGSVVPPAGVALFDDLDLLPLPAWDIYPPESNRYISKLAARQLPVTTVEFSRGCIYKCDFCGSKNTMGRGYRKKSPERCADEMVRLAALGFREAVVVDDIFTSDHEWAAAVCEAIIAKSPGIAWSCTNGIRADSADPELFALMRRAGCFRVYLGLESGSEEVLRAFGKGGRATLDSAELAVRQARAAGLEPNAFFLVGLTGDTSQTMQSTIDLARRLELDTMKCGICVPFPGTQMFNTLQRGGHIKTLDWDAYTVYNDADAIFDHPTLEWPTIIRYFRRFYRQAYFGNPRYLWRRLRYALRAREVTWNLWYAMRFLFMLVAGRGHSTDTPYAHRDQWAPSDLDPSAPLGEQTAPRAKRGGGATGRDGLVTIRTPRRQPVAGPAQGSSGPP